MKNKIIIVGVGPGEKCFLTFRAEEIIKNSRCVVAAERHAVLASGQCNVILLKNFNATLDKLAAELLLGDVAVLVSGDPGIYSLLPLLKKRFPQEKIEVIPGISSLQMIAAAANETWNETVILSGHGREIRDSKILDTVDKNRSTAFFCGNEKNPAALCALLAENDLDDTEVIIGENLSYPHQRISIGKPSELAKGDYDPLAIIMVINASPAAKISTRPRDKDFIRGEVPMTREEVRSLIIDKLELTSDAVVWDIGAGTGSVTVAAALASPESKVCAVEHNHEAASLIKANIKKFRLFNVTLHEGKALEKMDSLPYPTHVFIGGSGSELKDLLKKISALGSGIRVVVSCVTLKTSAEVFEIFSNEGYSDFDAVQINISRTKKMGASVIMSAQNPITIMSAQTADNINRKEVF